MVFQALLTLWERVLPANTGEAGAIHRGACFAGKSERRTAAPTEYCAALAGFVLCATAQPNGLGGLLQAARERSPAGWAISYGAL